MAGLTAFALDETIVSSCKEILLSLKHSAKGNTHTATYTHNSLDQLAG